MRRCWGSSQGAEGGSVRLAFCRSPPQGWRSTYWTRPRVPALRLKPGHALEKIALGGAPGGDGMGDGVRRPARCMRPGSRPIRDISEAGRWVRYLPASPSRAMPAPGPSGSSLPIMLRPGFPVPGMAEGCQPSGSCGRACHGTASSHRRTRTPVSARYLGGAPPKCRHGSDRMISIYRTIRLGYLA